MFDLLDEPEMECGSAAGRGRCCRVALRAVAFEHVRFGYAPDKPLMRDVSFTAEPGQKIAVVGTTGAWQNYTINLLMRFYEIDGGRITLDGVDASSAWIVASCASSLAWCCRMPGCSTERLPQKYRLWLPRGDARRDRCGCPRSTGRLFVRTMPQGYDTRVANDAESISQGQRQLLTHGARVLLNNPAILILDEATSSVDTRTELAIGRAMDALMHGRTSFVIAHRLLDDRGCRPDSGHGPRQHYRAGHA